MIWDSWQLCSTPVDLSTVKPVHVLSDHAWAKKEWSLNRGGLLIEVKMHCKATIGTRPRGPLIEVVSKYR